MKWLSLPTLSLALACWWFSSVVVITRRKRWNRVKMSQIQSWKQSCKSVSTCNQKPASLHQRRPWNCFIRHISISRAPQAPVFLKLFISRWYFRRHIFSSVGMRRVSCVQREREREAFNWHLQIWHASDLRTVVRRGLAVISLSVRWKVGRPLRTRVISDRLVWQWRFVGIGGNLCVWCRSESRKALVWTLASAPSVSFCD